MYLCLSVPQGVCLSVLQCASLHHLGILNSRGECKHLSRTALNCRQQRQQKQKNNDGDDERVIWWQCGKTGVMKQSMYASDLVSPRAPIAKVFSAIKGTNTNCKIITLTQTNNSSACVRMINTKYLHGWGGILFRYLQSLKYKLLYYCVYTIN